MGHYLASPIFFEDILASLILASLGFVLAYSRRVRASLTFKEAHVGTKGSFGKLGTSLSRTVKEFCVRYPALLSGYMIYGYLFISTVKFFLDEKKGPLSAFDIFVHFDSLLWMWLLALALVKIIEIRSKLHREETTKLVHKQEIEVRQMQLATLLEIVRGLQHEVNNPLTIILMTLGKLERRHLDADEFRESIKTIRKATERISSTLKAFTSAKQYEVSKSPVGQIIKPPDAGG